MVRTFLWNTFDVHKAERKLSFKLGWFLGRAKGPWSETQTLCVVIQFCSVLWLQSML